MNSVFGRITTDVNRLNQDLNFWLGDPRGINNLLAGFQGLVSDLDTATRVIGSTAAIGNVDFLRILGDINTLNTAVGGYTKTLNLKKPLFDAVPNLTGQILWSLRQQRQGADVLSKAINSKMPPLPAAVGPWIADQITQKLDGSMKIYSSPNTFPSPSGSSWNQPKPNQPALPSSWTQPKPKQPPVSWNQPKPKQPALPTSWNQPKPTQQYPPPYQPQPYQPQPYQPQPYQPAQYQPQPHQV
jgi:hypothetical protein